MNRQTISPIGDSAVLIHFGDEIDLATNQRVHALDARLRARALDGIVETVPAYATLLVHYDPLVLTHERVAEWLKAEMEIVEEATSREGRRIEVPVQYGGERGPDLFSVAQ